jgi:hypothetical protein
VSKENGMRDGYQRKMKEVFIPREVSRHYSNERHFDPCAPIKCVVSITMHRAQVIQMVKHTIQLFRERYTEVVMTVQQMTRI